MTDRVAAVLRLLNKLIAVVASLVVAALLVSMLTAYLAVLGPKMPLLRRGLSALDQLFRGQQTQHIAIDVRLQPARGQLTATTTLTLVSREDARQRFYFLLNPGLHVRSAQAISSDGSTLPANVRRLWALLIVDSGRALRKGETFELRLAYDGVPVLDLLGGANQLNLTDILLNVDAFWYPVDAQSFFTADVRVTLPANLTLVYHGANDSRALRGDEQEVHWQSARPLGGMALIAGYYRFSTQSSGGNTYRLYLADDTRLDADRILQMMSDADRSLSERLGASGFAGSTLFISRGFRRGFNDGGGIIGLSIRYFRAGDYGFGLIAHEIAHNWWGATVSGGWLSTGTGAQWIVEGLAECSSLLATEAAFGEEALARRMTSELFDPARQSAVAEMTVLDNALNEGVARDTIYRKGAWVACMLRDVIGENAFRSGLRQVIDRHRYQQLDERSVQAAFEEASGQKLEAYFSDWLRSDRLLDLSLDATATDELTVNNLGKVVAPEQIELWTFRKSGGAPVPSTVHVGDKIRVDADTDALLLDPRLRLADVQRENNRYPRREDPFSIAASSQSLVVAYGSPLPWGRVAVRSLEPSGNAAHTWELERGLLQPPSWSPDGKSVVLSNSLAEGSVNSILTLSGDGARRTVGRGNQPAPGVDGAIYAVNTDRLLKFTAGKHAVLLRRPGTSIEQPTVSPDGRRLVFTVSKRNHTELHLVDSDGGNDTLVLSYDRDRMVLRWSADGSRLFAVVGGEWDWQIWEIPLTEPPRVLAHAAAAIGDLAESSDGKRLAFTAAATLDYPRNRRELFVMNLEDRSVDRIEVAGADLAALAWLDSDHVLVIAAPSDKTPWSYPERRTLQRIDLGSRAVSAWP